MVKLGSSIMKERKDIDFKAVCDPNQQQDCCEIIKDIVAMANSGGGTIFVGIADDGSPSGADVSLLLEYDTAKLTDKIAKYTGKQFADFTIEAREYQDNIIAALTIKAADVPLVFKQPGTYSVAEGKQKTAFSRGQVYFRHGAKSEPGTSDDLQSWLNQRLQIIRKEWLANIKKVVAAPSNAQVWISPIIPAAKPTSNELKRIRITKDPDAPTYGSVDPNFTHPHRSKEVIELVNKRIEVEKAMTTYDLQCVRRVHGVDERSEFFYKPFFASPRYSEALVDWLVSEYKKDSTFFTRTKNLYRALPH